MIPLTEVIPGPVLFLMALGLIGAAAGLIAELVWDEWQAGKRWREIDRLARVEMFTRKTAGGRRVLRGGRAGRRWEPAVVEPHGARVRPRS